MDNHCQYKGAEEEDAANMDMLCVVVFLVILSLSVAGWVFL
jgi:hypothetical protein